MQKIRVLMVEDHTMMRIGLSLVLQKSDSIELVGEAEDGRQGVELAKTLLPDVILMDIGLPDIDGIEATRIIKEMNLHSKVLIFTSREMEDDVFAALAAGADGYIMKGSNENQILSAITAVSDGTAWLDPAIARLVLSNVQRQKQNAPVQGFEVTRQEVQPEVVSAPVKSAKNTFGLTDRELEVLALIVDGYSNPQIAEKLVITRATAKAHVHSILQKLYVSDRTQAAVYAMREGLV